jgi:hypothetical protein
LIRKLLALVAVAVVASAARAGGPDPAVEVAARAAERGAAAGPLVAPVREAERRGLPAQVVADKVLEGLAKGVPADRVAAVASGLVSRLSEADSVLARAPKGVAPPRDRPAALADLANALGAGVDRASVEALVASPGARTGGADGVVVAARVLAALGRRGVPAADALPLGRSVAANPRSAPDVVSSFDAWRAEGGRDTREFLEDAERRVSEGRGMGGADRDDPAGGARGAGHDERGRWGGDGARPHGRRP